MISHEHKVIFIHIPKCAGTSVEEYFGHFADYKGRRRQDHRSIRHIEAPLPLLSALRTHENRVLLGKRLLRGFRRTPNPRSRYRVTPEQYENYYKFTIIRDPWSRVYSWYRSVKRDPGHSLHDPNNDDFNAFVEASAGTGMLAPIDYWIQQFDGRVRMDRIVSFNDLAEGMALVAQDLGIPAIELPWRLKSKDNADVRTAYNARARRIIEERYRQEIETYGFSWDRL